MPSDPRYLPVVRGAIGAAGRGHRLGRIRMPAITLALDEALANVIRHAYHNRADGLIELECRENADGLEITMLDNGEAPDKSKICARELGCDQPGRPGNSHHPGRDGHGFLRGIDSGKPVCGHQAAAEDDMKISIRDVGEAKIVEVEGDVDLGTFAGPAPHAVRGPASQRPSWLSTWRPSATSTVPASRP